MATPFAGDAPALAVSLVVHVALLLALAAVVIPPVPHAPPPITILQDPPDPIEPEDTEPPELVVGPPEDFVGARGDAAEQAAASLAPVLAETSAVPVEVVELFEHGDLHVAAPDDAVVPQGLDITADVAIRGDVAVGTSGARGAVDRLTAEIRASLDQKPTLVCWIFDQSISLVGQRQEIATRLGRVFDELDAAGPEADRGDLTHMVFAYGRQVTAAVPQPTSDCTRVVRAIESIPVDESGEEMTFTALATAAKAAKAVRSSPARRHVMIVAFTDEAGNDEQYADQVAAFCRAQAMRVFVVGVPAPFGRRQVPVRFVEFDPRYASDEQFAVVDQGPETLHPEVVWVRGGALDAEPMDSGFGPYSLSKVCAETGGIYFCVHANRRLGERVAETAPMASRLRYFFDGDVMRAYRPDYLPAAKVEQAIAANRAKHALVEAARSAAIDPLMEPRTTFPRQDDGTLAGLLSQAQRGAAVRAPRLDALLAILQVGQADRDKLGSGEKRWQAGYDLAIGRVLAAKIRTDAYNIILAQAKAGMKFADPRNDTWNLVSSHAVTNVGSQTEKLAARARMYLERVVREHPGTPWALIAADELRTPLGYEWRESFTGVNVRRDERVGNGNPVRPDDRRRIVAPPKPKRPLRNL